MINGRYTAHLCQLDGSPISMHRTMGGNAAGNASIAFEQTSRIQILGCNSARNILAENSLRTKARAFEVVAQRRARTRLLRMVNSFISLFLQRWIRQGGQAGSRSVTIAPFSEVSKRSLALFTYESTTRPLYLALYACLHSHRRDGPIRRPMRYLHSRSKGKNVAHIIWMPFQTFTAVPLRLPAPTKISP